ncbi:hypothetical protein HPP92_022857 [Vanilla planifolia]|uniref:Uncharacterized protein n=1 Tax=Vanilla planifolia TaxID=51239 RepID=A0A835UE79_VANPL|nr:hypothetical protein HPP92_022857 [Vanilla planifolia]
MGSLEGNRGMENRKQTSRASALRRAEGGRGRGKGLGNLSTEGEEWGKGNWEGKEQPFKKGMKDRSSTVTPYRTPNAIAGATNCRE